jgi:hypothetical protein
VFVPFNQPGLAVNTLLSGEMVARATVSAVGAPDAHDAGGAPAGGEAAVTAAGDEISVGAAGGEA